MRDEKGGIRFLIAARKKEDTNLRKSQSVFVHKIIPAVAHFSLDLLECGPLSSPPRTWLWLGFVLIETCDIYLHVVKHTHACALTHI